MSNKGEGIILSRKPIILLGVALISSLTLASAAAQASPVASSVTQDNYGGVSYSTSTQMKNIIYAEFGHNWRGDAMVRCANRESGFNAKAANYRDSNGGSYGLLQINGIHKGNMSITAFRYKMWNPYENVKMAHRLMNGAGLGPWGGGC